MIVFLKKNSNVVVKLNDLGLFLLEDAYHLPVERKAFEREDGYHSFPLSVFVEIFGGYLTEESHNPFEQHLIGFSTDDYVTEIPG